MTNRDIKLVGYIAVKSHRIPRNTHIEAKCIFLLASFLMQRMKRPFEGEHSE